MNPGFVADASVALAWAVASQSSPEADHLLDQISAGTGIAVPALWPFEVANVLVILRRRKRISDEVYAAARMLLDRLPASMDDEGVRLASTRTADLAWDHGLSTYDAAYLELAIRKQIPLASRDSDLNRAAKRCGVQTLL